MKVYEFVEQRANIDLNWNLLLGTCNKLQMYRESFYDIFISDYVLILNDNETGTVNDT